MKKAMLFMLVLTVLGWMGSNAMAGELEPPAGDPASTMRTLDEIYTIVADTNCKVSFASAAVPQTGQDTSYAAGDDGDLEPGVAWPVPRFTDNTDGTVTDNLTGLIWLKDANPCGTKTWPDAVAWCRNLADGTAGLTDGSAAGDWHLPTIKELFSLVDYSRIPDCLPSGHPFTNQQRSFYWSSTTLVYDSSGVWVIHFGSGADNEVIKSSSSYVRAVRGGQ